VPKRSKQLADAMSAFDFRAAREAKSMSQYDAAELLKVNQSSISRWEVSGAVPMLAQMAWGLHWQVKAMQEGKKAKRVR
jgi:DNA-binding transcriptional regulator YiaG